MQITLPIMFYAEGIEYDFECLKGHAHVDEMSECDEFKLKLKVFLMSEKRYVEIDGKICLVEELSQEDILNHLNDLLGENNLLKKELRYIRDSYYNCKGLSIYNAKWMGCEDRKFLKEKEKPIQDLQNADGDG